MRVVGYVRVSGTEQADEGWSLDAQAARIRDYCTAQGHQLVALESDALTGKTVEARVGLSRALERLGREADGILVVKLDRLTRSVLDLGDLLERYFHRYALLSVDDQIDTAHASGRLVLHLLVLVSQWEREVIGERTRDTLAHMREAGMRVGAVPIGSRAVGSRLEEDPNEIRALARIRELHAEGLGVRAIARRLTEEGIPARGRAWHPTTVARLLPRLG